MEETEHVSVFLGTTWDILGVPGSVFPPLLESTWGFGLAIGICCKFYASAKWWFQLSKIALVWLEMLATLTSTYPVYLCPAIFDMNVCLVDLLALYPKTFLSLAFAAYILNIVH